MFPSCLLWCVKEANCPFHCVVHVFCPQGCMVPLPCCVQKTSSQYPTAHPLNSHSSLLRAVHPPLRLSLLSRSLIIPYIYSPRRPACSMTPGLSPWRTNHAFHSGSKREVSLFSVFQLISDLHAVACWICEMPHQVSRVGLNVWFDLFLVLLPLV